MIGDYIILRRKELNMTRKQLAEETKMSYNYLNSLETNKKVMTNKAISKIAKALKVSEDELKYYNTVKKENGYVAEKRLVRKQIENATERIAKLETDRLLVEEERKLLIDKLFTLERIEDEQNLKKIKEDMERKEKIINGK